MTSIDNPNTIITTITKQLPNPVILTDIDTSCICFDTSNQRIGINSLNPTCALDIYNGTAKINRPFRTDSGLSNNEIVIWGDISGNLNTDGVAKLSENNHFTGQNSFSQNISYTTLTGGTISCYLSQNPTSTVTLSGGGMLIRPPANITCGTMPTYDPQSAYNPKGVVIDSASGHITCNYINIVGTEGGGMPNGGFTCQSLAANGSSVKFPSLPLGQPSGGEHFFVTIDPNSGQCYKTLLPLSVSSDRNLKTNITPFVRKLDIVKQLNPVNFQWIETSNNDYGFIAQELEVLIPEVITNRNDHNGEITKVYTHEAALHFISILTKAIQDLDEDKNKEILDLSNEVIELKIENNNLKARVSTLESENTTLKFQITNIISRLEVLENQL